MCELQSHPWFKGVQWDKLYQMEAAFKPEVKDELDTRNFEKFEEVGSCKCWKGHLLLICQNFIPSCNNKLTRNFSMKFQG